MKKHSLLLLVIFTILVFVQSNVASGAEILKFGHLNALSGGVSLYGIDSKTAITIAVEEINAKGGITVAGKNYQLEVIHLDSKFNPAATIAGYRRLVDLHKIHFIHDMGTETGRAITPHNEKDNVLLDVISSTETFNHHGNKLLLNQVCRPNGFNTPVANEAARQGLRRMAIIADDSLFGKEAAGLIEKEFEDMGGKVVGAEYVNTTHGVDFMAELTKLKGKNPDCMFIIGMEEPSARIAKQAREAGIKARLLFGEHFKKKIIDVVGMEGLEGTLFCGTPLTLIASPVEGTPQKYVQYREKLLKRFPGHVFAATGAYAYTWVYYTIRAIQMADTIEDVYKVRAKCSDAIAQSKLLRFEGFTKGGRGYGQPTYIMGVKDGKIFIGSEKFYPKSLSEVGEPEN